MNTRLKSLFKKRGSALITVIFLIFMMGLLATSILKYSGGERRGNERNRVILRAKNMAENVALYASEQVGTKIKKLHAISTQQFGTSNPLHLPPTNVLTTQFSSTSDVSVYGGIAYRDEKQCPRCGRDMSERPGALFRSLRLDRGLPRTAPERAVGSPPQRGISAAA